MAARAGVRLARPCGSNSRSRARDSSEKRVAADAQKERTCKLLSWYLQLGMIRKDHENDQLRTLQIWLPAKACDKYSKFQILTQYWRSPVEVISPVSFGSRCQDIHEFWVHQIQLRKGPSSVADVSRSIFFSSKRSLSGNCEHQGFVKVAKDQTVKACRPQLEIRLNPSADIASTSCVFTTAKFARLHTLLAKCCTANSLSFCKASIEIMSMTLISKCCKVANVHAKLDNS